MNIFLVCAAVFAVYRIIEIARTRIRTQRLAKLHGCRPPPHFSGFPFGLSHFFRVIHATWKKRAVEFLATRFERAPTQSFSFFGETIINTIDPPNIKALLSTPGIQDYAFGKLRRESLTDLLGDGIFTLDSGHGWEYSRTMLKPQFARKQVADVDMLERHVKNLLFHLEKSEDGVNLQPLFFQLTLDSATEFLFGESVGSLTSDANHEGNFGVVYTRAMEYIVWSLRSRNFSKYWWRKEMMQTNKEVHKIVDQYVEKSLRRVKDESVKGVGNLDGKYIFLDAIARETSDPIVLRNQMLNILLAGRDTTAGLLGFTFFLLSRHPRVYRKLRSELEAAFGTEEKGVWKHITFEGMKNVPYLRHVLNEVLRLYPPVPLNGREAIRDTVLPVGGGPDGKSPILVPAGTRVQYMVYAMHRREDLFGPDAREFRPERWMENPTLGNNWAYLPFNGGPRICLGQQYALTEAGFTVTRILERYEMIEALNPDEELRIDATLTISAGNCIVRLVRAQ